MTDYIDLTRFPRMEWPKNWERVAVPMGTGWHDAMKALLQITVVPAGDRRDRWVKKGNDKQHLKAKECAPALAPYVLRAGMRRCGKDVAAANAWSHLVQDIDAAPLTVAELFAVFRRALGGIRHVSWSTHSCRDGYASARLFLPLTRIATTDEAAAIWWWVRRRLLDAGLPEDSAKAGEPCCDSRAMDGRLFYLPSVPASMKPGDEGWGGVRPAGFVSADGVPLLDVEAVLGEARKIRASDEPVHLARFPGVPVPGVSTTARRSRVSASGARTPGAREEGPTVRCLDFGTLSMHGTGLSVREWAEANLGLNEEAAVGRWVFDSAARWAPGDSALNYSTARLHRAADGHLWAKDWKTGDVYLDGSAGYVPDPAVLDMVEFAVVDSGADLPPIPAVATTTGTATRRGDEQEALRLLKLRDYDAVEAVADAADEGGDGFVSDGLGAIRAEAVQDKADDAEQARKDAALAALKAKFEKKKAAAEMVPPEVVEAAREALRVGNGYRRQVDDHFRAGGITPNPCHKCGLALGTQHAVSGKGGSYRRGCGEFACPRCGPILVRRKIGAILEMPVRAQDGTITGEALGHRPVWAYSGEKSEEEALKKAWRRSRPDGACPTFPKGSNGDQKPHRESRTNQFGASPYVVFHLGDSGRIVLISGHEIPGREGLALNSRAKVEALVSRLVLKTYTVSPASADEAGIEVRAAVTGSVASSQGLTLDPVEVARVANASAWIGIGKVDPAELKAALERRGVESEVEHDDEGGVEAVKTTAFIEPATFAEAVEEAGAVFARSTGPRPVVPYSDPGIDSLIDEIPDEITRESA